MLVAFQNPLRGAFQGQTLLILYEGMRRTSQQSWILTINVHLCLFFSLCCCWWCLRMYPGHPCCVWYALEAPFNCSALVPGTQTCPNPGLSSDNSSDSSSHPAVSTAWASRSSGVCALGRTNFCQKLIDTVKFSNLGAVILCLQACLHWDIWESWCEFPKSVAFRWSCWALPGAVWWPWAAAPAPLLVLYNTQAAPAAHILLLWRGQLTLGADTSDAVWDPARDLPGGGCVTAAVAVPLCAEQREGVAAPSSRSARGGFVPFTLGWAPPSSINPAFCQSYFCSGSLADPRWAVMDLVPKWAQMWVELKSYQFWCMQGYFPKDVSSGKKRNGEAALFISVVFEFSDVDMGWMSVPG